MLGLIGALIQVFGGIVVGAGVLSFAVVVASFGDLYSVTPRGERGELIVALVTLLGPPFAIFVSGLVLMGFGGICRTQAQIAKATEQTVMHLYLLASATRTAKSPDMWE